MKKLRIVTGSLVGIALMAGSIGPAQARPRYDRWHHPHYRDRDGFGVGDAIGIAALLGAAAIVATSLSKDRDAANGPRDDRADRLPPPDDRYDARDRQDELPPPPAQGSDYGADFPDDRADTQPPPEEDFSDVAQRNADEERMTDDCARAARDEAQQREHGYAEVRTMDLPRAVGDGFDIDGEVEMRASYRAAATDVRRFTCSIRNGRVAQVYISRDSVGG